MNRTKNRESSLHPSTYRSLLVEENGGESPARCWNDAIRQEQSPWEMLDIEDCRFVLRYGAAAIPLSSIAREDLPPSSPRSLMGRILVDRVHLGKILSSRPGTEEVTFYTLVGRPHGRNAFEKLLDRFFLSIATPPLIWRRKMVVRELRRLTYESMGNGPLVFFDIGSGAGFDGIDLHRILSSTFRRCREKGIRLPQPRYRIINIDIDGPWLGFNQAVCQALFGTDTPIARRNVSIFDYLNAAGYRKDLSGEATCIISCNGFADFYDDAAFTSLLEGIRSLAESAGGAYHLVIPCSMKNREQESLSNSVGFNYIAKTKVRLDDIIGTVFPDTATFHECAHNQIVYTISGNSRQSIYSGHTGDTYL